MLMNELSLQIAVIPQLESCCALMRRRRHEAKGKEKEQVARSRAGGKGEKRNCIKSESIKQVNLSSGNHLNTDPSIVFQNFLLTPYILITLTSM